MSNSNYTTLLSFAYPGAQWTLFDTHNYDSLEWSLANTIPKPSLDDLNAKLELKAPSEALRLLREKRNDMLAKSDPYVLPDFPHPSEASRNAWMAYRQALRDLPTTNTPRLTADLKLDESSVTWPAKPTTSS